MEDEFDSWLEVVSNRFVQLSDDKKNVCIDKWMKLCGPPQLLLLWRQLGPSICCDFLQYLPLEISYSVLNYLDLDTAMQCRLVSKRWNEVVSTCAAIWKIACRRLNLDIDKVNTLYDSGCSAWKDLYIKSRKKLKLITDRRSYAEIKLCGQHTLHVRTVRCYNDHLLATGSDDRTVRLWQKLNSQFQCIRCIETHSCADLQFDAHQVATASFDTSAAVWDWQTGKILQRFQGHTGADYNCDLDLLVTGSSDKTVKMWRMSSGTLMNTLRHPGGWVTELMLAKPATNFVNFSKDDTVLLTKDNRSIKIWIIDYGYSVNCISTLGDLDEGDQFYHQLQFNGHEIACISNSGLHIWNVSSLASVRFYPLKGDKRLVAFGSVLIVVLYRNLEGDILRIIDTKTGMERAEIALNSNNFGVVQLCNSLWLNDLSVTPLHGEPLFAMSHATTGRFDFSIIVVQWKNFNTSE